MKLLVKLMAYLVGAQACLQVHTYLQSDPFSEDGMTIQIFEGNNRLVCQGGASKLFSNNQDWFEVNCPETGYRAGITENGRKGWVENTRAGAILLPWRILTYTDTENLKTGYRADLHVKDGDKNTYCCAMVETCKGNCAEWEYCLSDNHASCAGVSCNRCDFRSFCGNL
jgi:hypothetical protein